MSIRTPTRRGVLGAGGGLTAATLLTGPAPAAATGEGPVFVLVHGAWRGGWVWERVARRLRDAGARVYAPTLTGLAERSHLLRDDITLTTHIDDVVGELKWKDLTGVTLVGHSYAGMVITGVAEREVGRLKSIVYLDAALPRDGQAMRDVTGSSAPPTNGPLPPIPASVMVNPEDAPWVQQKLTPQPGGTFSEPVANTGKVRQLARRTYIQATIGATPFFTAAYETCRADPTWETAQLECRHDAMLDKPDELAAMLLSAARA